MTTRDLNRRPTASPRLANADPTEIDKPGDQLTMFVLAHIIGFVLAAQNIISSGARSARSLMIGRAGNRRAASDR